MGSPKESYGCALEPPMCMLKPCMECTKHGLGLVTCSGHAWVFHRHDVGLLLGISNCIGVGSSEQAQ